MQKLEQFAKDHEECTVTMRFQPSHGVMGNTPKQIYYVIEVLFPTPSKRWQIVRSASYELDRAIDEILELWDAKVVEIV